MQSVINISRCSESVLMGLFFLQDGVLPLTHLCVLTRLGELLPMGSGAASGTSVPLQV